MTDGIIQKVQKRILEQYYDNVGKGELTDIFVTELIAEIKKIEFNINLNGNVNRFHYNIKREILRQLIGDNQK